MFYKLKVRADAKRVPSEVLGFPVDQQVSTYVETTRDLVAEAASKNVKTVDVVAVAQLPERGEDGNYPRVFKLGDHQSNVVFDADEETNTTTDQPPADDPVDEDPKTDEDPADDPGEQETTDETTTDEPVKKKYRVLPGELGGGVEYPQGTVHEPGSILELTDEEVSVFAPGLIEPVEVEPTEE